MQVRRAGAIKLGEAVQLLASRGDTGNAIDGGAGSGTTAQEIAAQLSPGRRLIAYEPFPGNHRFWEHNDLDVELRTTALGSRPGRMTLAVGSVIEADSAWGRRGMVGYSSSGQLVDRAPRGPHDLVVDVVVGDSDLAEERPIGVVKLDLQGGEAAAVEGLADILTTDVQLAWVEFMPSATPYSLVDRLQDFGFVVFDTEYLLRDAPTASGLATFVPTSIGGRLSGGQPIWRGVPRHEWTDFEHEVESARRDSGLIQTDLLCVRHPLDVAISERFERQQESLLQDAVLVVHRGSAGERDTAMRERDVAVRERDAAVRERDAAVRERDAAIRERNVIVRSRSWRWTAWVRRARRRIRTLVTKLPTS